MNYDGERRKMPKNSNKKRANFDKNDKGWQNACTAVKITRTLSKLPQILLTSKDLPRADRTALELPYPTVGGLARILRGGGVGESQPRFSRNTLCELAHNECHLCERFSC